MKKIIFILFIAVFAFSFVVDLITTTATADEYCYPNGIATFKCIDGDLYLCVCRHKHWVCGWYADDCQVEP